MANMSAIIRQGRKTWIYRLGALTAVLTTRAAHITRLKVRRRGKESERKESEDTSEHGDELESSELLKEVDERSG